MNHMEKDIYVRLNSKNMTSEQQRSLATDYLQEASSRFNDDTDHNRAIAYEIAGLMSTPFILDARDEDNDIQEIILLAGELEVPSTDHLEKVQQLRAMIEKLSTHE